MNVDSFEFSDRWACPDGSECQDASCLAENQRRLSVLRPVKEVDIRRIGQAHAFGSSMEELHASFVDPSDDPLSEENFFLAYAAGKIFADTWK